jgi:hypothetical protein
MSVDETEYLERLFAAAEHDSGPLSDWERNFLGDQIGRWKKYGESMLLSPKQWAVLRRIGAALDVPDPLSAEGEAG